MKKLLPVICFLFLFAPGLRAQQGPYCIAQRFSETPYFDSSKITISRNVVYSVMPKWPGTGVDTLKMDLYYPSLSADALSSRPAIVFFYGGAWLTGSKNDAGIRQKCFEWARRGFVVAAPNYRLGWNCNATDLLGVCVLCQGNYFDMNTAVYRGAQDGKAAMRWLVANRAAYGVDTSVLFVGGESAGSFNAMHTAFWTHAYARKVFNGGPYAKLGSIDSAGAFPGLKFRVRGIINHCGAVNMDTALKFNATPMVAFHDVSDCVVPYQVNQVLNCCATSFFWAQGSGRLYNALRRAGVPAEVHVMPGVTPAHCSYPALTLVRESSCFLKKILCGLGAADSLTHPTSPAVNCGALQSLGVDRQRAASATLYPNPAEGLVNIRVAGVARVAGVELLDMQGRSLRQEWPVHASAAYTLQLQGFSAGSYLVRVYLTDGSSVTERLQVE